MAKAMIYRPFITKPNCTHITMSLLRVAVDDETCDICGKCPYLRVFFSCQEDGMAHGQPTLPSSVSENMDPRVNEMRQLGMSKSVIKQAESGKYTDAQLDKLIQQRKGVIAAIEQQSSGLAITHNNSTPTPAQVDGELNSKTGTGTEVGKICQRLEKVMKPRVDHRTWVNPKCNTKACYACRPYFKDRAFQSIDSIVTGDDPLILDHIEQFVTPSKVARQLGLPKLPTPPMTSYQSFGTTMTESTGTTSSSSSSYIEGFSSQSSMVPPTGLKYTDALRMQELEHQLYEMKGASSSSILNTTVPFWHQNQLLKRRSSVAYSENAVLLKLKGEVPNQVHRMGSSVSLPVPSAGINNDHTTLPLRISRTNSERSLVSDEVEVEGGLALTEEAVEMQTPDIITQI